MKRLKQMIMTSFSLRMSLYILVASAAVFILTFLFNFHHSNEMVKEEAIKHAQVSLDKTVLEIDKVLNSVETAVQNISWLVANKLDEPEYMYTLTRQMLLSNPHVVGSAIAFEPGYYLEKGVLYCPYSFRQGPELKGKQLGTEDYEYHYMEWYQVPKLLNKPYWSEPYYDEGGADMIMTTYSCPLYDKEGKLYAVFTADLSLEWFTERVENVRPYPNSLNMMISRGGSFLVHWRKEALLNETVFVSDVAADGVDLKEVGYRMINGEQGMISFNRNDEKYYLFYAPVEAAGWSVSVACPYVEIFAGLDSLKRTVILIFVIGLLLLTGFCYFTIRRLTEPLTRFAHSANEIAHGNFTASLPAIYSKDEMKTLHNSFEYMQHSLVNYMEELKQTTASKERIESELRIAREIQMGMVPKMFPPFPDRDDVDLYASLVPAKEVGGDLYDFFIDGNKMYFIVGDVSGKGVPASLVMAVTCRLFRTVASHFHTPAEIITALNDTLSENNESNMFCTFFLGILDLQTGEMKYCNAGHNAPVVMHASGEVEFMEVLPNLPLGLFGGFPYEDQECILSKGDSLFLYTDGVTEAENVEKELYSDEHLLEYLSSYNGKTPTQVVEGVMEDIHRHAAGAEQSDDITVMCLNYK